MTPQQFQDTFFAWLPVILTVATAAITAVGVLWSKVQALKEQAERQRERLNNQQTQITSVALATPAPAQVTSLQAPIATVAKVASLILFLSVVGCTTPVYFPKGSTVQGTANYTEATGPTAGIDISIPLPYNPK